VTTPGASPHLLFPVQPYRRRTLYEGTQTPCLLFAWLVLPAPVDSASPPKYYVRHPQPLTSTSKRRTMIPVAFVSALALLSGARASDYKVVNQLETSRVPQPAQRLEFGVDGDVTPFRFTFADSKEVRLPFRLRGGHCATCRGTAACARVASATRW
jgi:hypothetical protein